MMALFRVARGWWLFREPRELVIARAPDEVAPALRRVAAAVAQRGDYAAGYLAYEAAAAFGLTTRAPEHDAPPLLWFGLYRAPQCVPTWPRAQGGYRLGAWRATVTQDEYAAAVAAIKRHLAAGDTYQVNYTYRLYSDFTGDPWPLFLDLARAQPTRYLAYLDLGRYAIASAAPELFFRLEGARLMARPMKGTAPRGRTLAEDEQHAEQLRRSPKERAENLMIVDMIRNDLGRVAALGSVRCARLFTAERYRTLWQLTSTVQAVTRAPLDAILAALFPCASVTGAPKAHTMKLIAALETTPRGLYTGALGIVAPGPRARFAVAIRTAVIDRALGCAAYGVGGGIVWDSDPAAEYAECQLKAHILTPPAPPFALLETLLWTPRRGYFLLEAHLARLQSAARYFQFRCVLPAIQHALTKSANAWSTPRKVRLLLAADGRYVIEPSAVPRNTGVVRVGWAPAPVDPAEPLLYHKTTDRERYEQARAARPDCDEVLLWNIHGELTEATTANVVLAMAGALWTPPVASGLLPGTLRQHLLATGVIRERRIPVAAVRTARRLYLINALRRWRRAVLVE